MARVMRDANVRRPPISVPPRVHGIRLAQAAYRTRHATKGSWPAPTTATAGRPAKARDDRPTADPRSATRRASPRSVRRHAELVDHARRTGRSLRHGPSSAICPTPRHAGLLARVERGLAAARTGGDRARRPSNRGRRRAHAAVRRSDEAAVDHRRRARRTRRPASSGCATEWAEADGTWDRYVDAAHEAMPMYLVEHRAATRRDAASSASLPATGCPLAVRPRPVTGVVTPDPRHGGRGARPAPADRHGGDDRQPGPARRGARRGRLGQRDRAALSLLGDPVGLSRGARVRPTARRGQPVGPGLLGRVVDALGRPIDGGPPIAAAIGLDRP